MTKNQILSTLPRHSALLTVFTFRRGADNEVMRTLGKHCDRLQEFNITGSTKEGASHIWRPQDFGIFWPLCLKFSFWIRKIAIFWVNKECKCSQMWMVPRSPTRASSTSSAWTTLALTTTSRGFSYFLLCFLLSAVQRVDILSYSYVLSVTVGLWAYGTPYMGHLTW